MANVYTGSKIFHFHDKLRDMEAGRLTPPLHVRCKPTNRCNHACAYCCYRSEDLFLSERMNERDEIPRDKMAEIAADLVAMNVRAVTFTGGGEPLLYPHIAATVRTLADGGVKVAMLSNGGLLQGEVAQLLARRAVWVRVSMDAADPALYARSRRVSEREFARVCDNLAAFAAIPGRTCTLGINLIVTRDNATQVLGFLELAKSLRADHVKVSAAVVATTPRENDEYLAPIYDTVKSQIAHGMAKLADDHFDVIDKFHLAGSDAEGFERSYDWCPFAQCLTVIAADQNVYTCQDKAYTSAGLLGSIRGRSFREFWGSDEHRRRLAELHPSQHCRHHCVAHGKNLMLLDYFSADQEHLDFV